MTYVGEKPEFHFVGLCLPLYLPFGLFETQLLTFTLAEIIDYYSDYEHADDSVCDISPYAEMPWSIDAQVKSGQGGVIVPSGFCPQTDKV